VIFVQSLREDNELQCAESHCNTMHHTCNTLIAAHSGFCVEVTREQSVAACCGMLQCVGCEKQRIDEIYVSCSVLQCAAACCSALQPFVCGGCNRQTINCNVR